MDILSSPSRSAVDRQPTARRGRPSPTCRGLRAALGVIVVGAFLAGCGNKGPLVPPEAPAPKSGLAEPGLYAPLSGRGMIGRHEAGE